MCGPIRRSDFQPTILPLRVDHLPNGQKQAAYTYPMAKVLELKNGRHVSSRGMAFDQLKWTHDPNHVPGSHNYRIHELPASRKVIENYGSFGSHPVILLPSPRLSVYPHDPDSVCAGDGSAFFVYCLTCEGIDDEPVEMLQNPDFLKEMKMLPPGYSYYPNGAGFFQPPISDHLLVEQKVLREPEYTRIFRGR